MWPLVSDIHLMPGLSAELQEVAWLDGVTGPALGHRFTGRNAHPAMGEWETVSTVVACDPPRCFAWAVGDPGHPSATWRFTLRPDGTGTLLEQWYQMGPARSGLNIAIDAMPDKEAEDRLRPAARARDGHEAQPGGHQGKGRTVGAHRDDHRGLGR